MSIKRSTLALLMLALVSCAVADNGKNIDPEKLKKTLALGQMIDINAQHPDHEHQLLLRLYEVPIFINDCFVETHGICQNEYYISVSTYDEYPEINVYQIPYQGELLKHEMLNDKTIDRSSIKLTFNKYTSAALKNNPKLKNQTHEMIIKLGPRNMEIEK